MKRQGTVVRTDRWGRPLGVGAGIGVIVGALVLSVLAATGLVGDRSDTPVPSTTIPAPVVVDTNTTPGEDVDFSGEPGYGDVADTAGCIDAYVAGVDPDGSLRAGSDAAALDAVVQQAMLACAGQ